MKYIKLFMLLAVVTLFAACSDDESFNTNQVTVGFANATESMRETASYIHVPINIEGARNGKVTMVIKAEEVGDNPAKENENYIITDKTITVNVDTLKSNTVNVEICPIDDDLYTGDRKFKLTIASAQGATIGNASTEITIIDNDANMYDRFSGKWLLTATDLDGAPISAIIKMACVTDETKPEYGNMITATSQNLIVLQKGLDLDYAWHFTFEYNDATKTGKLGFEIGEMVTNYSSYTWAWLTETNTNLNATWTLGEDGSIPEIVFPADETLYLYQYTVESQKGPWQGLTNIKLTKKK